MCQKAKAGGLTVFLSHVTCPHLHLLVTTDVDLKKGVTKGSQPPPSPRFSCQSKSLAGSPEILSSKGKDDHFWTVKQI